MNTVVSARYRYFIHMMGFFWTVASRYKWPVNWFRDVSLTFIGPWLIIYRSDRRARKAQKVMIYSARSNRRARYGIRPSFKWFDLIQLLKLNNVFFNQYVMVVDREVVVLENLQDFSATYIQKASTAFLVFIKFHLKYYLSILASLLQKLKIIKIFFLIKSFTFSIFYNDSRTINDDKSISSMYFNDFRTIDDQSLSLWFFNDFCIICDDMFPLLS